MIDNVTFYHLEYTFLKDRLGKVKSEFLAQNEYCVLTVNEKNEYWLMLDIKAIESTVSEIVEYAIENMPEEFPYFDKFFNMLVMQADKTENFQMRTDHFDCGFNRQDTARKVWVHIAA